MNERFLELAKLCTNIQRYSYESQGGGYNYTNFDKEKFAELLIKECALQCFHNEDMDRILNHFGMLIEDEELEDGCPCGFDGGTSCGAVNCEY